MSPTDAQGWIAVAKERGADAQAIYKERPNSVGCVYMAGYAIECSLKALLQRQNKGFPKHGQDGHNLAGLWQASGFKLAELNDSQGIKTFFLEKEKWNTALRYETSVPNDLGLKIDDLMKGAMELTGWIQTRVRRTRR